MVIFRAATILTPTGFVLAASGCISWTFDDDVPYLERLEPASEDSWFPSLTYQWDYRQLPEGVRGTRVPAPSGPRRADR